MFVLGTIGNSLVSVAALRQHRSMENKIGRTNVHMMVLHLTIAGICFSLKYNKMFMRYKYYVKNISILTYISNIFW